MLNLSRNSTNTCNLDLYWLLVYDRSPLTEVVNVILDSYQI